MLPRGTLLCVLLLVGLASPEAGAQGPAAPGGLDPGKRFTQYNLDVWTTASGLPQNSVNALLQTRDGYLWLGTYGGLVRFDGVQFAVFDRANTEALKGNGIQALFEDHEGVLWIGTNGGGVTRLKGGIFSTFTTREGLAGDIVRAVFEDREGNVWIGTNDGLSCLRDGRFTNYTTANGLSNNVVRAIVQDRRGRLWVGTNGGGLDRLEGGRFVALGVKDGLPSNTIFSLYEDRAGALWIGTNGAGLARLRDDRIETFTTRDGLPSDIIWSIRDDAQGSLWIGTYGGGLARFRDGRFASFTTRDGLPNEFVRALWQDREGSLWIGTYSGGLCRLRDGKFTTYTTREGLSHDFARTVYEDRAGAVWIGTTGGGLCRLKDGGIRCYGPREGLASDIRALHEDRQGTLWIGAAAEGLFRSRGGRFERLAVPHGPGPWSVSAIAEGSDGTLWVASNGQGLMRLAGGAWRRYTTKDGLPSDLLMAAHVDRAGTLWIGTDGAGLVRFENGRWTRYTTREGLGSDIVFSLHEDEGGVLWIGTSGGGLSRLADGKLATFGPREGLPDDVVFQILEDDHAGLWLSGNKGISRVARGELEAVARGAQKSVSLVSYGLADGMKSAECSGVSQPAGWRGADGRLWFPTPAGVVAIDPARLPRNTVPPPVKVESVVVDGKDLGPGVQFDLPPGRKSWEFHYAGLSFLAPKSVQFKYRLKGFDKDWIAAGTRRTAYYTNLPPGSYTFRVVASNNDGVWNLEGDAVSVRLRPRFRQTLWFPLLIGSALATAGATAYRLRVRALRARQRALEEMVERRTHDLLQQQERTEAALLEVEEARREAERQRQEAERHSEIAREADALKTELLSIAAHDLRSPLSAVLGYADLVLIASEQGAAAPGGSAIQGGSTTSQYAELIRAAAYRMLSLVDDLLETAAIDSGRLVLNLRPVDLSPLARAVAAGFGPVADRKRLRVAVDAPASCLVEGDEPRLRQVMENLVDNAIKYSPEGKAVWLRVEADGKAGRVMVQDEGPGLTADDMKKLFGRFQRLSARPTGGEPSAGLGLSIVKHLVELHGGRAWAESPGAGQGSTFAFELPLAVASVRLTP